MLLLPGILAALAAAPQDPVRVREAILEAEDARPVTRQGLAPLLGGLHSRDTVTQRLAVRGLGRQERADLVRDIAAVLDAPAASVRAEAANALGQAVTRGGASEARPLLEQRLGLEDHPVARGVLYRTLGRLPNPTEEERRRTELLLIQGTRTGARDAAGPVLEGAAHGLFFLFRRTAATVTPSVDALERLVELTQAPHPPMIRRLAMAALVASGRTDSGALLDALHDTEREVRRLALSAAVTQNDLPGRERIVRRAWQDPDPGVRYEAVRAFGRRMLAEEGCTPLLPVLEDPAPAVRLLAIDLLGQCGPAAARTLGAIAAGASADSWHEPARALVALARVAPALADSMLPEATASQTWWVRMYAAAAATETRGVAALERLAADPHPNVREAALRGLARVAGAGAAAPHAVAALESTDYQLLMAAARVLDSVPGNSAAFAALLRALERTTRERRETSRDARLALLQTIAVHGDRARAAALRPYLTDFDPAVAVRAAEVLAAWTGEPHEARPRPLRPARLPSWTELAAYDATRAVIHLEGGDQLVLRLYPFDAPTNVARFLRLARARRFDGLTFHRVVPNFVIQGGSPGANEYMGDGPYTRDELGLRSNLRGTVGLSTRGRDTGDGQLYVNLVDNLRLDHDYTVWAEVIEGLEILDAIREGAVIQRVELVPPLR
jgi:cyclophilin family peptidyl-prolyl cis-trans isomerase